jgi:F420-dependent oxidoreductase-like protein
MRIGLQVIRFDWPGSPENVGAKLGEIATVAEQAGFHSIWVMDHFFQIDFTGPPEEPMLEGYTAMAYIAGQTRRIKVGILVGGVVYRQPGILVKTATTLDVLSGGRSYFGIGAAWFGREARGLGVPFPPQGERYERLEETLQIAHRMWSGDATPFRGKHYTLDEPLCVPAPISEPHPPIMVGGSGERKTLRLVAQYADACNLDAGVGMWDLKERGDRVRHKLAVLEQHCRDIGRPYAEIERTALGTVRIAPDDMSAEQVIEVCRVMEDAGIEHLIFNMSNVHEIEPLRVFGDRIIPAVAGRGEAQRGR